MLPGDRTNRDTLLRNDEQLGAEFLFSSIQELCSQREENKARVVKLNGFQFQGFSRNRMRLTAVVRKIIFVSLTYLQHERRMNLG